MANMGALRVKLGVGADAAGFMEDRVDVCLDRLVDDILP